MSLFKNILKNDEFRVSENLANCGKTWKFYHK